MTVASRLADLERRTGAATAMRTDEIRRRLAAMREVLYRELDADTARHLDRLFRELWK